MLVTSQTSEHRTLQLLCVFTWGPLSFLPERGSLGTWVGPRVHRPRSASPLDHFLPKWLWASILILRTSVYSGVKWN